MFKSAGRAMDGQESFHFYSVRRFWVWLCMGLVMSGAGGCAGPKLQQGTYRDSMDLRTGIYRRSMQVHVPAGYTGTQPVPLVVVLHGAFSSARELAEISGWNALADEHGFFVLYPDGIGLFGLLRHWNAGHCCGRGEKVGWDDVAFIDAAMEGMQARYHIDPRRIYLAGFSNGAMMAYRFAVERPGRIAALAAVSGTVGSRRTPDAPEWILPEASAPLPVLILHGMADPVIPFESGTAENPARKRIYRGVPEAVDFWLRAHGDRADPERETLFDGHVERTVWSGQNGMDVRLYAIDGWGHRWPGAREMDELPKAHPLRALDGARLIWEFFDEPLGGVP